MGQFCSSYRRLKPRKPTELTSRPPPRPLRTPPPTPHLPRISSPRKTNPIVTNLEKEAEEPDISSHPALRDSAISITVTDYDFATNTNPIVHPVPNSQSLLKPPPALLQDRPLIPLTPVTNQSRSILPPAPTPAPISPEVITATSVPLPQWTNKQCRAWLTEVLITYANRPSPVAHRLVSGFQGWGASLHLKSKEEWDTWLGEDGRAIWALLKERQGLRMADYGMQNAGQAKGVARRWSVKRNPTLKSIGTDVVARENRRNTQMSSEADKQTVNDAKMQTANEWGKDRLAKLTEEREKVRMEREQPMEGDDRTGKSWFSH